MEHLGYIFEALPEHKKDILVALLSNIGFSGFEEGPDKLTAYINKEEFDENAFGEVIKSVVVKYVQTTIAETNWNAQWESSFKPVDIPYPGTDKTFVHLRASFHPETSSAAYNIEVTPKMSFGTGHHPTTYLMVQMMSTLNLTGSTVIDYGTGTGVLAILAEKLGAAEIEAIDNDDWSINNAKDNLLTNKCTRISLRKASTPSGYHAQFILANINLNIISENLRAIDDAAESGATLLFSGVLEKDEHELSGKLLATGFIIQQTFKKQGWIAVAVKKG